jgi:uncharacterized protein YcnI
MRRHAPLRHRCPAGFARAAIVATAIALMAALAPAASAHVDVLPAQVVQGEAREFTIRVPNERDLPTTAVAVDFPDQITVFAFADPPGDWRVQPVRGDDGRFTGVRYTGGRIPVDGYADFTVLATAFEAGEAVFPARQTYADEQVKPWTGPPEPPGAVSPETGPTDPGPAAAVRVGAPGEAPAGATGESAGPAAPAGDAGDEGSGAAIWLGVIAIGISALALLGVGLLWSTRPARLPEDE